jgi:hypothetical protein
MIYFYEATWEKSNGGPRFRRDRHLLELMPPPRRPVNYGRPLEAEDLPVTARQRKSTQPEGLVGMATNA